MLFFRRTRRLSAWIACLAILCASLAPSLAQAFTSATGGGTLVEICTAVGTKWVKLGGDQAPQSEQIVHFEHCPFCLSHDGPLGMPPAAQFHLPAVQGQPTLPILYTQSPRPLFSWAPAQSRAPPSL